MLHFSNTLLNIELETIVIIQVKSFIGDHYDLSAVNQVRNGIEKYNGNLGQLLQQQKKQRRVRK